MDAEQVTIMVGKITGEITLKAVESEMYVNVS